MFPQVGMNGPVRNAGMGLVGALAKRGVPSPQHMLLMHSLIRGTHPMTAKMSPAARGAFGTGLIIGHQLGQQASQPQQNGFPQVP